MKVDHAQAPASVKDGQVRSPSQMGPLAISLDLSKVPPFQQESTVLLLLCMFLIVIFSIFLFVPTYVEMRLFLENGPPEVAIQNDGLLLLTYTASAYKSPTAFENMENLSYIPHW